MEVIETCEDENIKFYLEYLKYERRVSDNTVESYGENLKMLTEAIDKNILSLTSEDIRSFLNSLELTPKTKAHYLSVLNSFYKAASVSHIKIHCIELDKDHIHLLLEFKPSLSIEQVVRRLKQLTTKYIWEENEEFLRNFYWKNKRILWSGGYFCSTIGEVSEKKIKEYIENQG